jgi:hypothetical protein
MPFSAQRVSHTHTIHLEAPASRVFPLFTPAGERAWAADWQPEFLYPATGEPEVGAVFISRHAGEPATIWTIIAYDPARRSLEYLRTTPGSRVGMVRVACEEAPEGTTRAAITYTFTALNDEGNAYLAGFTAEHYRAYLAGWERAIGHYLRTGQQLPHA